jgi:protein-L-isoaspartate(D-aspartate) O-methyltransferase
MATVPRHLFVPREYEDQAYDDAPLPIGLNQTISQPFIVALMTQALELTGDSRVLEIGTGSGYQAAVLATITPHVWSVEALPILADSARERLARLGYRAEVKTGDGRLGWPESAPYDAIIVTAAPASVPPALVRQLAPRGRLVVPVGANQWDQWLWLIRKDAAGRLSAKRLGEVRFVPLVSRSEPSDADAGLAAISAELERLLR